MAKSPISRLSEFYGQAILTPDLLCLNCQITAWNRAACRCSEENRRECLLFATDMANKLGRTLAQNPPRRRPASSTLPTS